jgi:putative copper resistance protein D
MTALGIATRWVHLAASLALVGGPMILLLAGRSDRPTARAWQARVVARSRILAVLALASGLGTLAIQTVILEGRSAAALLELDALRKVALETQSGHVWLARQGLLVLLLAFLLGQAHLRSRADWLAARGEVALLAVLAASLLGLAGHAAAVEPDTGRALINDAMHLVAAGVWIGGLWPLAVLLRGASTSAGADARPYAVLVARRFSKCALVAMLVLLGSGVLNAALFVGDVAGLVGTSYGRWLLVKLVILTPILVLAWINRRTLPALSHDGETVGRPAMRRLATFVTIEGVLALGLLVVVAVLVGTPPARHQVPTWPFSFRLSTDALAETPALPLRVLVGSQLAVSGVVIAFCALVSRRVRASLLAGSVVLLAFGLGLALPPLAIDAYPLTYRRSAVPYAAASIAAGSKLYAAHCAACHGPAGAGDGMAGLRLPRPPADLRAAHTLHHTAGDLYWWISEGIPVAGMPGFGGRLSEEERWDLVNFVRALAAANEARRLGPELRPDSPRIVAPDASFAVGPTPPRSLRDYRGRKLVLLVLYTLPESRARLAELAENYPNLVVQGVEVVAVPRDADPGAIRRLGAVPPIWFPVVTEGAGDLVAAYGLFAREPHAEFLIDRQGYLRAISAGERSWPDVGGLLTVVHQLNDEKTTAPDPGEHVH